MTRRLLLFTVAIIAGQAMIGAASQSPEDRARDLMKEGDGFSAESVRRPDLALARFREADQLVEHSTDLRLRATVREKAAQAMFNSDLLAEAVVTGRQAVEMARRAGAFDVVGDALRITGGALIQLARFEEAEATLKDAADISARYGTIDQLARALSNLSANARLQGKLGDAIGYGQRAIGVVDLALAKGDTLTPRALFAVPFNLGKAMADSGDYMDSRVYLERAFTTAERLGDIGGELHVLFDTGEWYEVQGDRERARRYYTRTVEFARGTVSGEESEGKALRGLGRLALAEEHYADAVGYLAGAVRVFEARQLQLHIATTLVDLARARAGLGAHDEAARDLGHAIEVARRGHQSSSLVLALIERGRQRVISGRLDDARSDLDDAVAEADRERLLPLTPAAWVGRAALAEARDELPAALAAYERSADALNRIRGRIVSIDLRTSFSAATHDTFAGMVRVLLALHRRQPNAGYGERALVALERERSLALGVAVNEARAVSATNDSTQPAEARITRIQNALFVPDLADGRRQSLLRELDDAERDLALGGTGAAGRPARASRTSKPDAPSLADLQSALAPNDVVLEYTVAAGDAAVFVVTREAMSIVPLALPDDLDARVRFFVAALGDNARAASIASGRALAATVLTPVLNTIAPTGRLLIVAAGPLARLPFAALPVDDARGQPMPLLATHDVSYLPSLTLFEQQRAANHAPLAESVLAVADAGQTEARARTLAPLPASRTEARSVVRHMPVSRLLVGSEATEHAVKVAVGESYSILHLATHALLDPAVPDRSAVLLGASDDEDGLLQSREIYQLPLQGSLVVLSGCRTADGQVSGAEGLRSLSRAFLQAGGRTVIGSLWDLPDVSTAGMVMNFYASLETGHDAGAALRAAQQSLAGVDPYGDSRTWAAMVVMGDPSLTIGGREAGAALWLCLATVIVLMLGLAATFRRRSHI